MNVKDSVLHRTLQRQVRKQDHAELLRMLELVAARDRFAYRNFGTPNLVHAFDWTLSPQGAMYWAELSDLMQDAGHPYY